MTSLLLKLAGPLQAWGVGSRYTRRMTEREPSKSGVIGMLAAARGIRRTEPIPDELLKLNFAVRIDQPGKIIRDFQTAVQTDGTSLPLSDRYYIADAVFVAAIEGERELLTELRAQLRQPTFQVYLGRRSCSPTVPVLGVLKDADMVTALQQYEWQASAAHAKSQDAEVSVEVVRDLLPDEGAGRDDSVRDLPVSFAPEHRRHDWRAVKRHRIRIPNPHFLASLPPHEPSVFGDD